MHDILYEQLEYVCTEKSGWHHRYELFVVIRSLCTVFSLFFINRVLRFADKSWGKQEKKRKEVTNHPLIVIIQGLIIDSHAMDNFTFCEQKSFNLIKTFKFRFMTIDIFIQITLIRFESVYFPLNMLKTSGQLNMATEIGSIERKILNWAK